MRRIAPWALLALLVVGSVTAALVGQVDSPSVSPSGSATASASASAAQWVNELMATTRAAGSAHFSESTVTKSSIPALNSGASGQGVVDFARHRATLTEVQSSGAQSQATQHAHIVRISGASEMHVITIGNSTWEQIGAPFPANRWFKFPMSSFPSDRLRLPLGASEALVGIEGPEPVVGVRKVGTATVAGVTTTQYRLTTARPHPCNAPQAAALRGNFNGPTNVWVDGHGRLVKATLVIHAAVRPPASSGIARASAVATAPLTTTATLRLGHFGVPARITAPADVVNPSGSGTSFAIGLHRC